MKILATLFLAAGAALGMTEEEFKETILGLYNEYEDLNRKTTDIEKQLSINLKKIFFE